MRASGKYSAVWIALALAIAPLLAGCHKTGGKLAYSDADSAWRYVRGDQSAQGAIQSASYSGKLDILWQEDLSEKPQGPQLNLYTTLEVELITLPSSLCLSPHTRSPIRQHWQSEYSHPHCV